MSAGARNKTDLEKKNSDSFVKPIKKKKNLTTA
jgi:hypothetical protein